MIILGKTLICLSLALLFLAYSNFAPTALGSDQIADYVKNHFVREMIFGAVLAGVSIWLTVKLQTQKDLGWLAVFASITVLPFWIAAGLGWSTGGIVEVWGDAIDPGAAYVLHGTQVGLLYLGIVVLGLRVKT